MQCKPIPVKLSEAAIKRLDRVSDRVGLENRSALIKLCITSFLDYVEDNDIRLMPEVWRRMLEGQDGRRKQAPYTPYVSQVGNNHTVQINSQMVAEDRAPYTTGHGKTNKHQKEK